LGGEKVRSLDTSVACCARFLLRETLLKIINFISEPIVDASRLDLSSPAPGDSLIGFDESNPYEVEGMEFLIVNC
jgi:hypothetical protein